MQIQNNLEYRKNEIISALFQEYPEQLKKSLLPGSENDCHWHKAKEIEKVINFKLYNLITYFPLGSLGRYFINIVNDSFFKNLKKEISPIWRISCIIDSYVNENTVLKSNVLESLSNILKCLSAYNQLNGEYIDKKLIRQVYLFECVEITTVFQRYFSVPPITLFDSNRIPLTLHKMEAAKSKTVTEFTAHNKNDLNLEKKVTFIQRHIRGKIRNKTEILRISKLYFNDSKELAIEAIKDADIPYKPVMCNAQLSVRIVNAAKQVKLFSTVKHLAAANYVSSILDTCLYGRKNLIDMYMEFRPAALSTCDIEDGDFNVICFGPDLIDTSCLRNRTIGLVFDLDVMLNRTHFNKNPAIFFKQRDFGFRVPHIHEVKLPVTNLFFNHTDTMVYKQISCTQSSKNTFQDNCTIFDEPSFKYSAESEGDPQKINLQLFKNNSNKREVQYSSELPKYSFISYNTKDIFQILTLNFFRFIDTLKDEKQKIAQNKIAAIYNDIAKLNDQELVSFLTDVGKKMSNTCEFNFSGAYKIDLNALQKIKIYEDKKKISSVKIKTLIEELNSGCNISLHKLSELAPEICKSVRLKEFIASKSHDKLMLDNFF
ncbi:MAG: hypothetical protein H0W50_00960 [Parachlamydiaceae bacterium]|nr:hypothetical protein [Parachlamydiaceae bacterium]